MDEMKITTKFMRGMVSKLVKRAIRKKVGYDVDIELNEFCVTFTDGKAHVHLNAEAELKSSELTKILKNVGLD